MIEDSLTGLILDIERVSEIELVLTPKRSPLHGRWENGFSDYLVLNFSERIMEEPQLEQVAKALIDLTNVKRDLIAEITYLPVEKNDGQNKFYKSREGRVYTTDFAHVVGAAKKIVSFADGVTNDPMSLCMSGVVVEGLDYFNDNSQTATSIATSMEEAYSQVVSSRVQAHYNALHPESRMPGMLTIKEWVQLFGGGEIN